MTPREASETIEAIGAIDAILDHLNAHEQLAFIRAKQALDILATLEESLSLNEPVTIEKHVLEWQVTRDRRTHLGIDVTDALGQLCMTLSHEKAE